MMDTSKLREEILHEFEDNLEEKVVAECVKICQNFNMSAADVHYKWEAMQFGTSVPKQLNADSVQALRAKCQSDLAKANAKKQQARANLMGPLSRNLAGGLGRSGARLNVDVKRTPVKPAARRQDGFGVPLGEERRMPVAGPSKVAFVGPNIDEESRKKRAYRYMYEKVSERSEALDDKIDDFGELVKEHYNINDLGDPSAATEEEVTVVGRITLDAETSSGPVKLNEASLTLETSRMMGSGVRIPLRFDPNVRVRQGKQGVGGVGLFPGAIVALRGKNGGGGWFLVTEILCLPPSKAASQSHGKSEVDDSSFSMYIACGPFTPDNDVKYTRWQTLLSKIKADKPAVVLLIGPFVDSANPLIKNGEVDLTPTEMFREHFTEALSEFLSISPQSLVLIVPSVRDIISDHAVFPQCELGPEFSDDPRIQLLPNPSRFSLNGISFGVSSMDVFFHLRKEEFFKRAQEVDSIVSDGDDVLNNDLMANTCRHLLRQRSFYPLFPAPLDLSHEVNLDVTHSDGLNLCGSDSDKDSVPDVLVLPSRLKHFSKVVDSTVAINPSFLIKGTYAIVTCTSPVADISLKDRLKVDLLKLE
ncbi:hypothetical protein AcW1_007714 [Taiwanofungus camphoratus]|nr:hypothetical protein AcW2_007225 [Antrodia cinnamomea]KAI0947502.1 hypothetical protein AcV7_009915 [Antrodia cinnamomea]KAI0953518.1 hypothetical protein AcW1_007714 [Antrodia cinnamomea]